MINLKTILEELSNRNSQMKTVTVDQTDLVVLQSKDLFQKFCEGIRSTQTVTSLNFNDNADQQNDLSKLTLSDFKFLIESIASNPKIINLNLANTCLDQLETEKVKILTQLLQENHIQILDLSFISFHKMKPEDFESLLNALKHNKHLVTLSLIAGSLEQYTKKHMMLFSKFLSESSSLEHIQLYLNNFSIMEQENFEILMDGIAKSKKLHKLEFECCGIGSLPAQSWFRFIETLFIRPKITVLNLNFNQLGNLCVHLEKITKIFKKHTSLIELHLADNKNPMIAETLVRILHALGGDQQLKQLEMLERFDCSGVELNQLKSSNSHMRGGLSIFCETLATMKNLTEPPIFCRDLNKLSTDRLLYITSIMPSLNNYSHFSLYDLELYSADEFEIIFSMINKMKNLQSLNFKKSKFNALQIGVVSAIAKFISTTKLNPLVTKVELGFSDLNALPPAFMEAIAHNQNIEHLIITDCNLLSFPETSFQSLVKTLTATGRITQFDFDYPIELTMERDKSPLSVQDKKIVELKKRLQIINQILATNQHRQALIVHKTLKAFEQRKIGNKNFSQAISTKILSFIYTTYTPRHKKLWAQITADPKKHPENLERQTQTAAPAPAQVETTQVQAENDIRALDAEIKALQDELQGLSSEKENVSNKP